MGTITRKKSYDFHLWTSLWNSSTDKYGPWTTNANTKVGQWDESRFTNPDTIPAYRLLIARHLGATTTLSATRYDILNGNSKGQIEFTGIRRSNGEQIEGVKLSGVLAPVSILTNPGFGVHNLHYVNNLAVAGIAKKIYAAQNTLQGVVCFGELGETVRGIRGPLKALYKGFYTYLTICERRARKARRTTRGPETTKRQAAQRAIAGTWLEFVFGWLPLVHDIEDATKALARIVTYRPPVEHVHFKCGGEQIGTPAKSSVAHGAAIIVNSVVSKGIVINAHMYGQCINRNGWNGAIQDLGFNWRNWVPSLWELIPYSFLADYFTNIGDIINAAAINRSLVAWLALGNKTEEMVTLVDVSATFQSSTPLFLRSGSISPGKPVSVAKVSVIRSPYVGSLVPSLAFTIPGLGMQWLNITALVAQAKATSRRIVA